MLFYGFGCGFTTFASLTGDWLVAATEDLWWGTNGGGSFWWKIKSNEPWNPMLWWFAVLKTNMEPNKLWFVDVSPFNGDMFRFHVSFRGCNQEIQICVVCFFMVQKQTLVMGQALKRTIASLWRKKENKRSTDKKYIYCTHKAKHKNTRKKTNQKKYLPKYVTCFQFFWWFLFFSSNKQGYFPNDCSFFSVLLVVLHFLPRKKKGKHQQIPNTSGFWYCFWLFVFCFFFSTKKTHWSSPASPRFFSGTSNGGILTRNSWWHLQGWSWHEKNMFLDGPDFGGSHQYICLIYGHNWTTERIWFEWYQMSLFIFLYGLARCNRS